MGIDQSNTYDVDVELNPTNNSLGTGAQEDRIARVALSLLLMPGDERLITQVHTLGAPQTIESLCSGVGPKQACQRIDLAIHQAKAVLDKAVQQGFRFIIPTDAKWPEQLNDLDNEMPIGLWVRGDADFASLFQHAIAIVGSRASTAYGERIAAELGTLTSDHGYAVISGAAFGIDAAAHRGALGAGGQTVAVLASGVDVAYPSAHQGLIDRIATQGLVVSEVPPGTPPRKHYFLVRNRIIAALSQQTVVVEAAVRSGALSTAHWAQDLGRTVWGVSGPITSAASAGVHFEIQQGYMQLLASLDDILKTN